ncbi:MAG: FAD:protein FMN transferase [Chitinophagaceae bacterium]|nr:FAD:protein FMN transferase [Chitinophagaceae bacterium]
MGSPFAITIWHTDSAAATACVHSGMQLADSLIAIFSDYDSTALVGRLNRLAASEALQVPAFFYHFLQRCRMLQQRSAGAFNVAIGPLSALWRQARRSQQWPADSIVQQARHASSLQHWQLQPKGYAVKKLEAAARLDFGGIAKGYIAQQVADDLMQRGATAVLVDAGGDLAAAGVPPGQQGWRILVNKPQSEDTWPQPLLLGTGQRFRAVATSGDLYQGMLHEGQFYSHIIDPATGYGVRHGRNVSVLANDAATADWLATAASILPAPQVRKLCRRYRAAFIITTLVEGKIITYRSDDFPALQQNEEE